MTHVANLLMLLGCSCLMVYGWPSAGKRKGQLRHLLAFVAGGIIAAVIILNAARHSISS